MTEMSRRKLRSQNGTVQSEQLKLVKIQDLLENLLGRVNESINALKVEELQLKSNAVAAMKSQQDQLICDNTATTSTNNASNAVQYDLGIDIKPGTVELQDFQKHVNEQEINLDMFVRPMGHNCEEEESD